MANQQFEQRSFDAGEIAEDHVYRADLAVRARSLKRARNVRLRVGGPVDARPGTTFLADAPGDGRLVDARTPGGDFYLLFTANRLRVYSAATRQQAAELTGRPWTAAMLPALVFAPHGDTVFVFHEDLPTQAVTRAADGTWSSGPHPFAAGAGGASRQPFHRFAAPGVTLTPSALTGSLTLSASAPYFAPGHVGLRLRLQGREVQIEAVSGPTSATATALQELYPTKRLTVTSTAGFAVGELIEGEDTRARAEVIGVPGATTLDVLMLTFHGFAFTSATDRERVIGPNAVTQLSAAFPNANLPPSPVLDWQEQALSALRGYPATGTVHRGRLWMARLRSVPLGVLASAIGDFTDFEAGVGDASAIFEQLQSTRDGAVRHLVSQEQLLVLTSTKVLYVPESESNPIRPTSIGFIEVSPDGAAPATPAVTSNGVIYAEFDEASGEFGGAVSAVFPTGDVRRSWRTADLSTLAPHLIRNPRFLTYVAGTSNARPERYVYVGNADGSLAVVYYSDDGETTGWVLWDSADTRPDDAFRAAAAIGSECWVLVRRRHGGVDRFSLEMIDEARTMDGAVTVTTPAPDAAGSVRTPSGLLETTKRWSAPQHAGATCALVMGGFYVGETTVAADGTFPAPDLPGTVEIGFGWAAECVPWSPQPPEDQRARRRARRIVRAYPRWKGRYLSVDGKLLPIARFGEPSDPPLRDEETPVNLAQRWSREPTVSFARPYPGARWTLYGYSLEVSG